MEANASVAKILGQSVTKRLDHNNVKWCIVIEWIDIKLINIHSVLN